MNISSSFIGELYRDQIFSIPLTFTTRKFDWLFIVDPIWLVWHTYISHSLTHWLIHWPVHNILDAPTKRYFFYKKITKKGAFTSLSSLHRGELVLSAHALMIRKSCAVGMCNVIQRNHLNYFAIYVYSSAHGNHRKYILAFLCCAKY